MDETGETGMPWSVDASITHTAMEDKPLLSVSNKNKSVLLLGNGTPVWLTFGKVKSVSQITQKVHNFYVHKMFLSN